MSWLNKLSDPAFLTALAGLITAATALVTAWKAKEAAQTANLRLNAQSKRMSLLEDGSDLAVAVDTIDERKQSGKPPAA